MMKFYLSSNIIRLLFIVSLLIFVMWLLNWQTVQAEQSTSYYNQQQLEQNMTVDLADELINDHLYYDFKNMQELWPAGQVYHFTYSFYFGKIRGFQIDDYVYWDDNQYRIYSHAEPLGFLVLFFDPLIRTARGTYDRSRSMPVHNYQYSYQDQLRNKWALNDFGSVLLGRTDRLYGKQISLHTTLDYYDDMALVYAPIMFRRLQPNQEVYATDGWNLKRLSYEFKQSQVLEHEQLGTITLHGYGEVGEDSSERRIWLSPKHGNQPVIMQWYSKTFDEIFKASLEVWQSLPAESWPKQYSKPVISAENCRRFNTPCDLFDNSVRHGTYTINISTPGTSLTVFEPATNELVVNESQK